MDKKERLLKKIEENCGVITTKEVLELGFHKDTIKALVLDNTLEKVATDYMHFLMRILMSIYISHIV